MRNLFLMLLLLPAGAVLAQVSESRAEAAGDVSPDQFQQWRLAAVPNAPANNQLTPARVSLGKMLFFDPRLSRDGTMACASCHNPSLGWADGLAQARGFHGKVLKRSTPSIVNVAYNYIHMWDGSKQSLEDQALGPMEATSEMNTDLEQFFGWINSNRQYKEAFALAYPDEAIGQETLRKSLASFQRTIVSRSSPFDRWLAGDRKAMTAQQLRGLQVFTDKDRGNCMVCHAPPNFTDDGFHNIGLASFGQESPDMGRYTQRPVRLMRGAFKTPSLRDIGRTAPYFHDGSARTLLDVIEHYAKGGEVRTNLSPNMKALTLTAADKADLLAFLQALSSPPQPLTVPVLPGN
jgi:cytochrome c peroxidase